MKVKKLLSVLGLGLFAAVSVGAGVALNKESKAESVNADGEWLFHVTLDLAVSGSKIPTYDGFDGSSIRFKCWNSSDYDGTVKIEYMHETGMNYRYMKTMKFASSYTFNTVQFIYHETSGDKYSDTYGVDFNSSSTYKAIRGYNWQGGWSGGDSDCWDLALQQYIAPCFDEDTGSGSTHYFVADVAHSRYWIQNITFTEGKYANFYCDQTTNGYVTMIDSTSLNSYFSGWGTTWATISESGTFDIILDNNYSDNGVVRIKKHVAPNESFIYYFTETADPTPNKIYSFGGSEQFGSWPGTNILDVEGVEDVSGVLHFEGYNQRIYKIPFTIGYPEGDSSFLFNYNGSLYDKTVDYTLEPEMGYYWSTESGDYALAATRALEFLLKVEAKRNASSYKGRSYSICGISAEDAKDVCDEYNVIGNTERQYILRTTTKTWNPDYEADDPSNTEIDGVSYAAIMGELSRIAGVDVGLSSRTIPGNNGAAQNVDSTTLIAIISVICLVSISSIAVLIVVKKRKHQ